MSREVPMLFNGEMVRAILGLDGKLKTQTRRPMRTQPAPDFSPLAPCGWYTPTVESKDGDLEAGADVFGIASEDVGYVAPARPGDTLWVRETWGILADLNIPIKQMQPVCHFADARRDNFEDYTMKPSIHMPRWACRLLLPLTAVRCERAADISEADAVAEGFANAAEYVAWWNTAYPGKPWCWVFEWKEAARV